MKIGAKVVCVNDVFDANIQAIYKQLPKKDEIYTVRACSLGREKLVAQDKDGNSIKGGASEFITVRILLEELRNEPDFTQMEQYRQELGFNAERFREIEEHTSQEYNEAHMFGGKTIKTPDLVAA